MYKDNKDFTGIWTPVEVLRLTNIGTTQKYILSIITALDRNNEGCYASNKYFAEMMQITPGRVSEIISELHQKELLTYEIDQRADHIRIIRPRIDIKANPVITMDKTVEPIQENSNSCKGKTVKAIRENPKHNNKDYSKDYKKDERELSHFDFINKKYPKEVERLKKEPVKDWKLLIRKFNNKYFKNRKPNTKDLENYILSWINNQKNIKNNSVLETKPPWLKKIS